MSGEDETEGRCLTEVLWLTSGSTKAPGPVWHTCVLLVYVHALHTELPMAAAQMHI